MQDVILAEIFKNDKRALQIVELAREFRKKYIDPVAFELDKKLLIEPQYHPEEIVRKGCEYGLLTLPLPSFLGGGDGTVLHISLLMEELCAGCAGIANIFGAHYLGLSGILLGFDLSIFDRFLTELVEKEKKGIPVLFSAAITEPMAGTDVEEKDFLKDAKLITYAKRVSGGYLLNGRKVFISNGSTATYHLIICPVERDKHIETFSGFVVPSNSKGFSIGRVELKMGQRACHAAELIFDDCFVPAENRLCTEGAGADMTEVVLAASRAPVAAIATGIARGAYEKVLEYCKQKGILYKQWVQFSLAQIYSMISSARYFYINSALTFDRLIFSQLNRGRVVLDILLKATSFLRKNRVIAGLIAGEAAKNYSTKLIRSRIDNKLKDFSLGISSMSKFSCSDIAVNICLMAMEIMGNEGIEERNYVEKYLRDAKLTQIYEGTNQLNRYEVYKRLVVPDIHSSKS